MCRAFPTKTRYMTIYHRRQVGQSTKKSESSTSAAQQERAKKGMLMQTDWQVHPYYTHQSNYDVITQRKALVKGNPIRVIIMRAWVQTHDWQHSINRCHRAAELTPPRQTSPKPANQKRNEMQTQCSAPRKTEYEKKRRRRDP